MPAAEPARESPAALLNPSDFLNPNGLIAALETLFDADRIRGFDSRICEHKYRRGGKTLCTFLENSAVILIALGKAERDRCEAVRNEFSSEMNTLSDGEWRRIPVGYPRGEILRLLLINRKPNRK